MSEEAKTELSCGEYGRGAPWYPLRKWWQSSRLFNQDVGLPPFLESGDPRWMDVERLQRSLAVCSWPGYIPTPLSVPYISGSMHHSSQEISKEEYKWRVILDVAHFTASEISLSVKDGFLEVGGKHEERADEHGFIARCFTRKYRLPAEIDVTKIVCTLSVDGILTVEAPVPETSVPAAIPIPIKVEMEVTEEHEEITPDTNLGIPSEEEVRGEETPLDVHGDEAHPVSSTAGLEEHEERREREEETPEEPAGEAHPSVPADGEGIESLPDSSEHRETLESQESPDTDMSLQPEHTEPSADVEIQVMPGSEALESQESPDTDMSHEPEHDKPAADVEIEVMAGSEEAAEEISKPEEPKPDLGQSPLSEIPSQVLQAPEQQHTK